MNAGLTNELKSGVYRHFKDGRYYQVLFVATLGSSVRKDEDVSLYCIEGSFYAGNKTEIDAPYQNRAATDFPFVAFHPHAGVWLSRTDSRTDSRNRHRSEAGERDVNYLWAIDPGVHVAGWALFGDKELLGVGLIRGKTPMEMLEAANDVRLDEPSVVMANVIIEVPESYTKRANQKGSQTDLIDVALVGGLIVGVFASGADTIHTVRPKTWKGNVDGDAMLLRIQKRLSPREQALLDAVQPPSLRHNAIDALGIALWKVGRL